jgi:hypothetical protein
VAAAFGDTPRRPAMAGCAKRSYCFAQ